MKFNWKWIGFVVGVTLALGIIVCSSFFRAYTLKAGAAMGLTPSISGVLQGLIFLAIFVGICYMATSFYGKPYTVDQKKPDRHGPVGRGGGF